MPELTPQEKREIIERRHLRSDGDKQKHDPRSLEIHHKDRNPQNNDPDNLRVLTRREHQGLHKRNGR